MYNKKDRITVNNLLNLTAFNRKKINNDIKEPALNFEKIS